MTINFKTKTRGKSQNVPFNILSKKSIDAPSLADLLEPETIKAFDAIISNDYDPFTCEGKLVQISVDTFLHTKVARFQRKHDAKKQKSNYNSLGGAKTYLERTPLRLYVEEIEDYLIPDSMHTSAYKAYKAMQLDPNGTIWVEERTVKTMEQACEIFDAWNASGISPASAEMSVVTKYLLGQVDIVALVHVMNRCERKLATFQEWHTAPFDRMSTFRTTVAKGKFQASVKMDPLYKDLIAQIKEDLDNGVTGVSQYQANLIEQFAVVTACEVINSVDLWRGQKKDSVQLIEGLTCLFVTFPHLMNKPQPLQSLVDYFNEATKQEAASKENAKRIGSTASLRYLITQDDWCFTGQRVAQKDGQSIAYLILRQWTSSIIFREQFPGGLKGTGGDYRKWLRLKVDPYGEWNKNDDPNSDARNPNDIEI